MRALVEKLKKKGILYRTDVSAATLCTFRIGGVVALVIEPQCERDLCEALEACRCTGVPFEILGNGSNVLFEDGYLSLAVIRTAALDAYRMLPNGAWVGCGMPLPRLCHLVAMKGLSGLEFACGIPATLGGALAMNAGAHGKQISDLVKSVRVLCRKTGEIKTDFDFKKNAFYRNDGYWAEEVFFLSAELELEPGGDPLFLLAEMQRLKLRRKTLQPLDLPSAGCVFKRIQPDVPIGQFLDELGCKGMRVGGAEVSQKHAAFIVNTGGATAADVKALMCEIQKKAKKERGMIPEREIRIIPNET